MDDWYEEDGQSDGFASAEARSLRARFYNIGYRQGQVAPSDSAQVAFQQQFMPTAIFLSRVSAASAFCSAICEPEFQVPASISKLDIVQSCQVKFQSIVAAFQESSDPVKPGNAFDLQRSTSEFESLCSELNEALPKELQVAFQTALFTQPRSSSR